MKKVFAIISVALSLAACTLETSGNGDLDGFWHLTAVDTLATGGYSNYSDKQVFWMFQGKLYNMKEFTSGQAVVGHFRHVGDSLFIDDVHENNKMVDDPTITDATRLKIYGIDALCERFSIISLSSGKMTLQSGTLRLYFKKQ